MNSDEVKWLQCAAHMSAAAKEAALPLSGTASGRVVLRRGAGGDRTLEIDQACESAMLRVLEREAPAPYSLVSEEMGMAGPDDAPWRVVIDPLDGSLNAKRGLEPFCASIAVARGRTLGDVTVGYIEDYTRARCFAAVKGAGLLWAGPPVEMPPPAAQAGPPSAAPPAARRDAPPAPPPAPPPADQGDVPPAAPSAAPDPSGASAHPERFESDLVEVVFLEAGRPNRHSFGYDCLNGLGAVGDTHDMRIRQIGSLALSLCYVATGVADVLVAAVPSRAVDVAAGLLILAEAGGGAVALTPGQLWAQPLDLEKHSAFVAWRAGLDGDEMTSRARELARSLLGC